MGPVLSVPLPIRAEACEKGILLFAAMLYLHCLVLKGCWECNKIIHQLLKQLSYWLSSELARHASLLAAVETESQRVWFSKAKWAKHWPALVCRYSSALLLESSAPALKNLLNSSFCRYLTPKTYAVNFHDFNVWGFTETSCFSDASAPQHLLWYPWGFPRDSCSRWPAHRVCCYLQPRYLPPVHASSCHTGAQKTLCRCVTVGSEASSHPGGRTGVRYSLGMVSWWKRLDLVIFLLLQIQD